MQRGVKHGLDGIDSLASPFNNHIASGINDKCVIALPAVHDVGPGTAIDSVRTVLAEDDVIAG